MTRVARRSRRPRWAGLVVGAAGFLLATGLPAAAHDVGTDGRAGGAELRSVPCDGLVLSLDATVGLPASGDGGEPPCDGRVLLEIAAELVVASARVRLYGPAAPESPASAAPVDRPPPSSPSAPTTTTPPVPTRAAPRPRPVEPVAPALQPVPPTESPAPPLPVVQPPSPVPAARGGLTVTIDVEPRQPVAGEPAILTFTVHNHRPSSASGLTLTTEPASGVEVRSAMPSQGRCATTPSDFVCSLGTLASGDQARIRVVVVPDRALAGRSLLQRVELSGADIALPIVTTVSVAVADAADGLLAGFPLPVTALSLGLLAACSANAPGRKR